MRIFKRLKQTRIRKRFHNNNHLIIENIKQYVFTQIFTDYTEQGWEVFDAVFLENDNKNIRSCKLRKGNSTLIFEWAVENTLLGSISGPNRIINGLAQHYNLTVLDYPSWCDSQN